MPKAANGKAMQNRRLYSEQQEILKQKNVRGKNILAQTY